MTDAELLKITLERLNLTNRTTATMFGVTERSIAYYLAGCKIPAGLWRVLLEHEAKAYQRQQDIAEMARGLGSSIPDPHAGTSERPSGVRVHLSAGILGHGRSHQYHFL